MKQKTIAGQQEQSDGCLVLVFAVFTSVGLMFGLLACQKSVREPDCRCDWLDCVGCPIHSPETFLEMRDARMQAILEHDAALREARRKYPDAYRNTP